MSTSTAEPMLLAPSNVPKKSKKKGKGKKVPLNAFLKDTSTGTSYNKDPPKTETTNSWADATDDIDPSEITTHWPEEKKMFDRSVLPSGPKASSALNIDKNRLPSSPPYTVYLGNLSFECTEDDIVRFFERKNLVATSVRLPMETGTNRMRGFGYAEFDTINDLMEALSLDKETMRSRPVSVDIAGGKGGSGGDYQGRRGDFGGEDRTTGDWRRDGGGDDNDGRGSPQGQDNRDSYSGGSDRRYGSRDYGSRGGGGGGYGRDYNRDNYGGGGGSRGDYSSRGRDDYSSRGRDDYGGGRREYGGGGGGREDYGGGRRDYGGRGSYDQGPPRRGFGQSWGGGDDERKDSYRRDDRYGGDRRDDRYGGDRRDDRYGGGDRRDDRYGDRRESGGRNSPDGGRKEEPVERPRFKLQPRSKPAEENTTSEEKPSSASIFGGAKPVDTAAKEREIEQRAAKEREMQEKKEKERQEKAASVFGGAKPVDTAAREKEIEEKLAKEKEVLERKVLERKLSEDKSPERYSNRRDRSGDRDRQTPEQHKDGSRDIREGSYDKNERSHDRRDDNRSSRGGRRRYSSEEEGRRGTGRRRGYHDDEGSTRDKEGGDRRGSGNRKEDDRSSQERGEGDKRRRGGARGDRRDDRSRDDRRDDRSRDDRRDDKRDDRSRDDRRDDRRGYGERRDYQGDRGGRGRGRGGGRSRDDRRDDDRGGRERPGKASTSAWSKGKPPSLGGDQKKVIESTEPVVFSQPSRYATLKDEEVGGDSGSGGERPSSPPPAQEP